jgi:hypothetical protein
VEAIGAVAEEGEEAEVAEDLELLTDFGTDMGIVGVESGEGVFENVDFQEREFGFIQRAYGVQYVEGPASFVNC